MIYATKCRPTIPRDTEYGMPHIHCYYSGRDVNSHRLEDGAVCTVCGLPATNAHHCPPKGTCPTIKLAGVKLRPALIAVCGSGTTGCHDGFHGGAWIEARWEWDDPKDFERWWTGQLLESYEPHDPRLYRLGRHIITDKHLHTEWEVRL